MSRRAVRRLHGEEGASLLVALAFLLLFAVLLTGLLDFAVTSFNASNKVIDRERAAYSAEAAVHTQIARVRQNATLGVSGQQCAAESFSGADTSTPAATATCVPQANSGTVRAGVDGPDNAILTRGGDLTVSGGGGGRLRTNANVFVNGAITVANSTVLDAHDGAVAATGSCSPSPAVLPSFDAVKTYCNATAVNAPQYSDGADPGYTSRFSEIVVTHGGVQQLPTPNPAPTCSGGAVNATVFSAPAVFTNVYDLTTSWCSGSTVMYFQPGAYYFDFQSRNSSASDYIWTIGNNAAVIGGPASSTWAPGSALPAASDTGPTACTSGANGQGVQFIMGGASQIQLGTSSRLELCPQTASPAGKIAVFGAVSTPSQYPQILTLRPSGASGSFGSFSPPSVLIGPDSATSPINGAFASWSANSGNAAENLSGFDWSSAPPAQQVLVPDGYVMNNVKVRAAHQETGSVKSGVVTATVSVGNAAVLSGGKADCTATFAAQSSLTTDVQPCTNTPASKSFDGRTTVVRGNNGNDVAKSLSVTWNVDYTGNAARTAQVDGVEIDFDLAPLLEPENGCVITGTSCPLLSNPSAGTPHDVVAIGGTVYAPLTDVTLNFSAETQMHFDWGVILRTLNVTGLPTTDTTGRFRLGTGTGRTVEVVGTSGAQRSRALVRMVDSEHAAPGFLTVLRQWSTAPP